MTTPNWKHWLLRHERAVAALERNPPRIAARIHRVSADELVEFCRVHEVDPDRPSLTPNDWQFDFGGIFSVAVKWRTS